MSKGAGVNVGTKRRNRYLAADGPRVKVGASCEDLVGAHACVVLVARTCAEW